MRLLIVDDSPVDLKLLRAQLEGEGHEVIEASNGAEALQGLEHRSVDAVISDILMPVMNGYRLCYEIRKRTTGNADVAIVLYTATYSSSSDRQLAQTMGADCYLFKPAPTAAILCALEEAQAKRSQRRSPLAPIDAAHVVDQMDQDPNESAGIQQLTLVRMLDLNQRLELEVARLTVALVQSHQQIEALTGHRAEWRSPEFTDGITRADAEGGPARS